MNGWILGCASGMPCRFFLQVVDDITKERDPGIKIIECTPKSLIVTSFTNYTLFYKYKKYKTMFKNDVKYNYKI